MLSLPFFLAKRSELPEPKKGQKEWDLFENIFGASWDKFDGIMFDQEEKITEFNYEKFIPKHILSSLDTQSEDFKNAIKVMNLNSKTEYEQHKENQQKFKELIPVFANLDTEESEILIHLLKNKGRNINKHAQFSQEMIDTACSNQTKERLAKISEEENFAIKNRFKHNKDTMKYAQKSKMPVDQMKVKDILRNQHIVKDRINEEIGTY